MIFTPVFYSLCCYGMFALGNLAYCTYNFGIKDGLKFYMISMTLPTMVVATALIV